VGRLNPNQLIVEGPDDLFSVVGLMRAHVVWPEPKENAPVWIDAAGGVEKILERGYLDTKLMTPGLKTLGVILDADINPQARYDSFRNRCSGIFPGLPQEMPTEGLVAENANAQRLGLWIMPDNVSEGTLETFLRHLVPTDSVPVWEHATKSVATARTLGANCRECHIPKANLYTWLAWHDEPGQSPGIALTRKTLDPHSPSSEAVVKWFRDLCQL
jgi:hypothetical protein